MRKLLFSFVACLCLQAQETDLLNETLKNIQLKEKEKIEKTYQKNRDGWLSAPTLSLTSKTRKR